MTKEIAKKLLQSGISSIQVSLDGSTEEVVDWLRNKKGAYKNAINAIKISFAAMCSRKLFMIFRKIAKNK